MKKILLLLIFLTSCHHTEITDPNTLRIAIGAEPDTLNPLTASDAYSSQILDMVNDSLIERDRDTLEFKPKIASRWEIAKDHLSYIFYLRQDVHWQDGVLLTADDVVYSFQKIQDPKVEAPFLRVYYADVEKVEKLDNFTVKFIYKKPYFLGLSVCGSMPILPKHLFDDGSDFNSHPLARKPVGSGPYKFLEWKTGQKIVLVRNENYWGVKPAIQKIEYKIVGDDTVSLQLLKKNEIDYAPLRPIQWMRQTDSEKFNSQFQKLKYILPGFNFIGWNSLSPFFADKNVRRAMTLLIDRQKILEKINYGLGQVVESPFFVGGPQYNADLQKLLYNPKLALELLNQAGWKDTNGDGILDDGGKSRQKNEEENNINIKRFEFTFLYPASSKFSERMAPLLKEDLAKVGIVMNIERIEWAAFLGRIEGKKFDATSLGWSAGFEDDSYQVWHSSQAKIERGSNFVSFTNAEADQLIENARTEFDTNKRNQLYYDLQKIIADQQPYTFLFSSNSLLAVSRRFDNVIVHKTGINILEWVPK